MIWLEKIPTHGIQATTAAACTLESVAHPRFDGVVGLSIASATPSKGCSVWFSAFNREHLLLGQRGEAATSFGWHHQFGAGPQVHLGGTIARGASAHWRPVARAVAVKVSAPAHGAATPAVGAGRIGAVTCSLFVDDGGRFEPQGSPVCLFHPHRGNSVR